MAESEARRYGDEIHRIQSLHGGRMLIPHQQQFASRYGAGPNVYWSRFDEAIRDNWHNALAMRRSTFIQELLYHRQLPTVSLPWHVEVDDPKDPDQQRIAERISKGIEAIPRFASMRLYLGESIWQGKYGSQVVWDRVMIDGKPMVTITDHEPVDGDSIVYKYDKTPGILIRSGWLPGHDADLGAVQPLPPMMAKYVEQADRARAFFLYNQFWRDHFIIQNFVPSSADFLFEGEKAAGIFGVGFRSRIYWDFQFREELRSWRSDALQRIGVNGMLYGFYQSGNPSSMNQVINSLRLLIRDNVTAFPVEPGMEPQEIRHVEPSQVGYDVIDKCVTDLEETIRRAILGQTLSGEAQSTGLGSEVAELHRSTFEHIVRFDAVMQQETLTKDLIGPMIRFNEWEYRGQIHRGKLPFRARIVYSVDKANVEARSKAIQLAYSMGLELDKEAVYTDLGLERPRDPANVLKKPEGMPGMGSPGAVQGGLGAQGDRTTPSSGGGFQVVKKLDGGLKIKPKPKLKPVMQKALGPPNRRSA